MKLKEYNKKSFVETTGRNQYPTVHISRRSGHFNLSKRAVKLLFPNTDFVPDPADGIVVLQDEIIPRDFYIAVSNSEQAFALRPKTTGMVFQSKGMATTVLDILKVGKSASFRIGVEKVEWNGLDLYSIITSNPINPK